MALMLDEEMDENVTTINVSIKTNAPSLIFLLFIFQILSIIFYSKTQFFLHKYYLLL